jgi:hypothetical protein
MLEAGTKVRKLRRTFPLRATSATLIFVLFLCSFGTGQNATPNYTRYSQPTLLMYSELVTLSEKDTVEPPLAEKLNALLTTPFVSNAVVQPFCTS